MNWVKGSFPARLLQKFMEDGATTWAVVIAWNGLFAMFPIVLFVAALLGLALRFTGFTSKAFFQQILANIPDPQAQQDMLDALTTFRTQSGLFFIIGLAGMLWGGSTLFGSMGEAFTVIYRSRPRDFLRQRAVSAGMILLFTVLAAVAVLTSSVLPALKYIPDLPPFLAGGAAVALQIVLGIIAGSTLFGSIYFVVPTRKQSWRTVWPGTLLGGVLFELMSLLFPAYLAINKNLNAYGATFGLFFLLMTFFFFLGIITVLGAEVNSLYALTQEQASVPAPPAHQPAADRRR